MDFHLSDKERKSIFYFSLPSSLSPSLSLQSLSFFVPQSARLCWPVVCWAGGGGGAGCTSGHNRLSVIASQTSGLAGEAGGPNPTTDLTTQTQTSYRASLQTSLYSRGQKEEQSSLISLFANCWSPLFDCETERNIIIQFSPGNVVLSPCLAGAGARAAPACTRHCRTEPQF